MWSCEYTTETKASSKAVWRLWTDVSNWKRWDSEVLWSRLEGPFAVGTRGVLKPKHGPQAKFVLSEVQEELRFVDQTKVAGTTLTFIHELQPTPNGTKMTHRVEITGLLAPVLGATLGRQLKAGLPSAVQNLAQLAENDE
jgi:uncharacterized protein YndB with AHSA1/START domain